MPIEINNYDIYDITKSFAASGYPMQTCDKKEPHGQMINRVKKLSNTKAGSGHQSFLKGVVVSHDIKATQTFWQQFGRYHFHDIISSQSKMHRILDFDIDDSCNEYVTSLAKYNLNTLIKTYKINKTKENYLKVLYNIPMGFELKARVVSNYLQLKTIYYQRKDHRLIEWKDYCKWIEALPFMKDIL